MAAGDSHMTAARKPALPDVFGRRLGWRDWFIKSTEWLWFRPLPRTAAELELEAEREIAKQPADTIRLNLESPDTK
jgi:hypothetical protein